MLRNGHIEELKFSLPINDWICKTVADGSCPTLMISAIVILLLSSGRHQVRSEVLKRMPSTFPFFEQPNAFSKFRHSYANFKLIDSHISLYVLQNSSHQLLLSGATMGTSSSWRWTNLAGILHFDKASVFTVFARMSKFWTELAEPNICLSSMKYLPSHMKSWYRCSVILAGTFLYGSTMSCFAIVLFFPASVIE